MKKVNFRINGIAPYYYSQPHGLPTPKTEDEEIKVAWAQVYHTTLKGKEVLAIPSASIIAVMVNGARMGKIKYQNAINRGQDFIKAAASVTPFMIPVVPTMTDKDIEMKLHWTNMKDGKGKMKRYPRINTLDWGAEFTIEYSEALEEKYLHAALEAGGLFCGIGGRRPGCGRFHVKRIK